MCIRRERLPPDVQRTLTVGREAISNDSPEARKDWPGCGWSVDGDDDEVVDRAVEDVNEVMRWRGHERTGQGHERDDLLQPAAVTEGLVQGQADIFHGS
jgi:hypothetical protein